MNQESVLTVEILDRSYKIKCLPNDALDLQEAARYLDREMRKISQVSYATPHERIAIVAALNICNDLLRIKKEKDQCVSGMSQRIASLQRRIEEKLVTEDEIVV